MRRSFYRLGRWLLQFNYVRDDSAPDAIVLHDLKYQVQEQRREIDRLKLECVKRDAFLYLLGKR